MEVLQSLIPLRRRQHFAVRGVQAIGDGGEGHFVLVVACIIVYLGGYLLMSILELDMIFLRH